MRRCPRAHGGLFDPDRYPFLEGRPTVGARQTARADRAAAVPDGTVFRALEKLLVLDGERISYRALDVEQIGSVYETMMGFRLETATGPVARHQGHRRSSARRRRSTSTRCSAQSPASAASGCKDSADREAHREGRAGGQGGGTRSRICTPRLLPVDRRRTPRPTWCRPGAMVLQPSDERRRSGSHYTPRALTEPIVRTTLEPVLDRARGDGGAPPTPGADPRPQGLRPGDGLGRVPRRGVPPARRRAHRVVGRPRRPAGDPRRRGRGRSSRGGLSRSAASTASTATRSPSTSRRCRSGSRRSPSDHALTFLDHALRHGDALVGPRPPADRGVPLGRHEAAARSRPDQRAHGARRRAARADPRGRRRTCRTASCATCGTRPRPSSTTCACSATSLCSRSSQAREEGRARGEARRVRCARSADGDAGRYRGRVEEARHAEPAARAVPLGDRVPRGVRRGNAGLRRVRRQSAVRREEHAARAATRRLPRLAQAASTRSHGNADLVAHFFRRAFELLREGGTFGLIATNTIAPGRHALDRPALDLHERRRDLRRAPTREMAGRGGGRRQRRARHQGAARRGLDCSTGARSTGSRRSSSRGRPRRPGDARGERGQELSGKLRPRDGVHVRRHRQEGVATPIAEMHRLIAEQPRRRSHLSVHRRRGGQRQPDAGASPLRHRLRGPRRRRVPQRWPELMEIVEEKVRPEREARTTGARWRSGGFMRHGLSASGFRTPERAARSPACKAFAFAFLPRVVFTKVCWCSSTTIRLLPQSPASMWVRFGSDSMTERAFRAG